MSSDPYEQVCRTINAEKSLLNEVCHDIWSHPELKFEEVHAHQLLTSVFLKKGFDVQPNFVLPTAFRAEFSNVSGSKPIVAFLCEYDALPEIGHACGHNLIAEAGLGAALCLQDFLKSDPKMLGTVIVFGTPAEEGGGGKINLINAGAFRNIDVCMMVHPSAYTRLKPTTLGIRSISVEFKGQAAHASSLPWKGLNALDAAVLCYNSVSVFRQQMKPTCRIHGIISKGGVSPNIIPEKSEMIFYVRGPTTEDVDILEKRLLDCFQAAAQATGCEAVIDNSESGYKVLISNEVLAKLYHKHAVALGIEFDDGKPEVIGLSASTDVGNVSQELPTIQPTFYIGTKSSNHNSAFTIAAGAEEAQNYTLNVIKIMALTAIDLLLNPDLVTEAKKQFQKDVENGLIQA